MAQTPGGTYYAASSELVSSWPATSLDLANQLESRFAAKAALSSSIIQNVSASTSAQATNNTSTYADTGLTATITPTKTTSKILVIVTINGAAKLSGNTGSAVDLQLLRGATQIGFFGGGYNGASEEVHPGSCSMIVMDSPSTTSATTYKVQFKNAVNAAGVVVQASSKLSAITLLEIAA